MFDLEKIVINGPSKLCGEVEISGGKNAIVAILPATIMVEGPCRIENVPNISDVTHILDILQYMGANIKIIDKKTLEIDCTAVRNVAVPYEYARRLRASYYFMGALLARFQSARVSMPGGCSIGLRPIDQHIKGFEALGVDVNVRHGDVVCQSSGLTNSHIYFDVVSVGATINVMLAATKAPGLTILENVAKEPHIVDVANFLNSMGANISGAGTDIIKIRGVDKLCGGSYAVIPDQIEAGTFMVAAAATGGDVLVKNIIPKHMECITAKLAEMKVKIIEFDDSIRVIGGEVNRANVKTLPYPGFPTDMHPQIAVLLTQAQGTSIINESVWESRFKYAEELKKMGANIQIDGKIAIIEGKTTLTGAQIHSCDLRAGAAMIIAGLIATGTTYINDIEHIERGYENIVDKFKALGADIELVEFKDDSTILKAN